MRSWNVLALATALSSWSSVSSGCIHDSLPHRLTSGEQEYSSDHPFILGEERRRRLEEGDGIEAGHISRKLADDSAFRAIRITPYFDNDTLDLLPQAKRDVIFRVVPDAIAYFTQTLRVVPVVGNLSAAHACATAWSTSPPVCATFVANETCLEMPIPDAHFGATRKCSTCSGTNCASGSCSYSASQGVANADFLLYIRAVNTSHCSGTTLAYASTCKTDQFDRPTFGMANFCPYKIGTAAADYDKLFTTAVHELTHALGFSSTFWAYMRNEDGSPRTPRDQSGNPPLHSSGTCHNGLPVRLQYAEPSNSTVQYSTERGVDVAKLVTPRVAAFVKAHFNCSSLTGAEIESNDPGCLGSHWEERLFEPEYMSPALSFRNQRSGLTLAFFEDSGWYKTNASMAQRLVFGARQGCSFATDKCVASVGNVSTPLEPSHYCVDDAVERCSVDATSRSSCAISTSLSVPSEYQYFPLSPTKGGTNKFADFCPLNVGTASGDCSVAANLRMPTGTNINILGETYCPTCRCAASSLRSSDSINWNMPARRVTGCYAMECIWSGQSLDRIQVALPRSGFNDSVSVNCTAKGQQIAVAGFSGMLTCPDPFVICGADFDDVDELAGMSSSSSSGSRDSPVMVEAGVSPTPRPTPTATVTLAPIVIVNSSTSINTTTTTTAPTINPTTSTSSTTTTTITTNSTTSTSSTTATTAPIINSTTSINSTTTVSTTTTNSTASTTNSTTSTNSTTTTTTVPTTNSTTSNFVTSSGSSLGASGIVVLVTIVVMIGAVL